MKGHSLTVETHWKLYDLNQRGVTGIPSVGVKSVDIRKNTDGEGKLLAHD